MLLAAIPAVGTDSVVVVDQRGMAVLDLPAIDRR